MFEFSNIVLFFFFFFFGTVVISAGFERCFFNFVLLLILFQTRSIYHYCVIIKDIFESNSKRKTERYVNILCLCQFK